MSEQTVELPSRAGTVQVLVYRGAGADTPRPAIVLGVEAYGINEFSREVAARLADAGYVIVLPDYYRGRQLSAPDDYLDFTEVMQFIDELDFTAGAHDQLAAVEYATRLDDVDPDRIAVWGYCTGATLSMPRCCSSPASLASLRPPIDVRFIRSTCCGPCAAWPCSSTAIRTRS